MQQKVNHLSSESKEGQAHEQKWKLKFEEEEQPWREEAATQSLITDGNQVLMRKELRDIQSRLRLLQVSSSHQIFNFFLVKLYA